MNRPALILIALLAGLAAAVTASADPPRIDGIRNFRQVNERIYRGAQPDDEAWPALARLGVKTVIDLRREKEHSTEDERRAVEAAGMRYVNFPMNGFDTPTAEQMARVIELMDGKQAVFVHCHQGRDRTGAVIATWRMAREQWPNEKALAEAKECGLHWYEWGVRRFIRSYRSPATGSTVETAAAPPETGPASSR